MNGDIIDQPYLKMTKSDQRILDRIEQISLCQKVVWIQGNHDNGYTPSGLGKVKVTRSYSIGKRLSELRECSSVAGRQQHQTS